MAGNKKEYSLAFIIGAQLKSSFGSAFKNAEKQLKAAQKAAKDCGKAWSQFGKDAAKLVTGVTAAGAAVVTAAWKMTDSIGENAVAIGRNADHLKMTTEEYQKLQYAFENAGLSGDEFVGIMSDLDSKFVQLASDSKAAKGWEEEFGLSPEKLSKMDPATRIERVIDFLNAMQDPIEKDRLAMELFGKSGAEMSRLISLGSDGLKELGERFERTGNMISEETVAQAEEYKDMKQELTDTVEGIKTQLFSTLLPAFTTVFGDVAALLQDVDWAAWGEKIAGWVQDAIPKVQEIAASVGEFIGKIWDGIQTVKDFVGGWDKIALIIGGLISLKTTISGISAVVKTVSMAIKLASSPWILVIGAVIAAIIWMIRNWDKVKEAVDKVSKFLVDAWTTRVEAWRAVIQAVIDWFIGAWESVKEFLATLWDGIVSVVTAAFDFIKSVAQGWWDWFIGVLTAIGEFFTTLWDNLKGVFEAFVEFFVNLFTGNWEALSENIAGIWEAIKNTVTGVFDSLLNIVKSWVDGILGFFKPITDFFSGIGDAIASIFGGKKTMQVEVQTAGADIPGHAAGGIFTRPHTAYIAEGGDAEAVVPLNNKPASQGIWETAGRMAGFASSTSSEQYNVSVPVSVQVAGNADADTVKNLRQAATDIEARMRAAIRAELAAIQREKARMAFR